MAAARDSTDQIELDAADLSVAWDAGWPGDGDIGHRADEHQGRYGHTADSLESFEVGRRARTPSTSLNLSQMPWNITEPTLQGDRGMIQPQRSVLSPQRPPYISLSDLNMTSDQNNDSNVALRDIQMDHGIANDSSVRMQEDILDSQSRLLELNKETDNFLRYTAVTAGKVHPQPLFFSDLAPVASSLPSVAASAFYHMLQLATNAAIEVWQSGPYEEITVQLWR
ncbi:unnamed protein product [Jaminaea pallidilutea]